MVNKKFNGIKPELNSDKAFKKTDVIIDFTVPNCTLEILKIASKLKKVVIGTTGFTRAKKIKLKNIQKDSNFKSWQYELRCKSINVFNRDCRKSFNDEYLSKIFEVHQI